MKKYLSTAALLLVCSSSAMADEPAVKRPAPMTDEALFAALNIMAVPLGPKGMVVKDDKGCLWMIKNAEGVPQLAAVLTQDTGESLCQSEP
ncbi:hypothetical protein [Pseudomonas aeruginosa]|uniref:hypothetical protein n=1 Tax=Pseudomonas aeruginosa TaxID=287 RepID=UPI000FC3FA16|nr:hypothetical protein [Pseudomonas aeruginosa]EKU6308826.1 hypothetical protein [Pseudomonas aeruginosa]EKX2970404.1 hypothetical protein [Pseudomonas aeruginosa]MBO8337023.1 hypothetical protein [Pseudomonas aeruginosa]MCO3749578.1 hypothetical protein [Pseudomonas aeruginosa]RUE83517.1 hypothetical protein IPC1135_32590 [Pseudomonas aeruginosa]